MAGDDRHANLGGDTDGELDVFAMHIGPSQGPVRLQPGDFQSGLSQASLMRYGSSNIETVWK
jgi:hypothetical protein